MMKSVMLKLVAAILVMLCALPCAALASPEGGSDAMPLSMKCADCDLSFMRPAVATPVHGLVMAHGGILGPVADWEVVNWDDRTLSLIQTTMVQEVNGNHILKQTGNQVIKLTAADESKLRAVANKIWASRTSVPGQMATDVNWNLYLIDGITVRKEGGMGLPAGDAADLEAAFRSVRSHSNG